MRSSRTGSDHAPASGTKAYGYDRRLIIYPLSTATKSPRGNCGDANGPEVSECTTDRETATKNEYFHDRNEPKRTGKMKGKKEFTATEAAAIRELLKELRNSPRNGQKTIRSKMRRMGFYMRDDWGLHDCRSSDFDALVKSGLIKIVGPAGCESSWVIPGMQPHRTEPARKRNTGTAAKPEFATPEDLRKAGFTGFIPVADLWRDRSAIPKSKGVYMVVRTAKGIPEFLEKGTGGLFKGKDPNVSPETLRANWVNGTCVVYIGQAGGGASSATLHSRLTQYLRFGQGKAAGHRGGRHIRQLKDAADLLFCRKTLSEQDPDRVETALIETFRKRYDGMRPFANLSK